MNRDTATARKLYILGAALIGAFLLAAPAQAQRTSLTDIDLKLNEVLDILLNGPPPPTERVVFVTSTTHNGNFGGLSGADAICNARATEADLPGAGNYLAWLSDDALSPADRLVQSSVPYVRTDGAVVASDWADLTDGILSAPILLDEKAAVTPSVNVWTATDISGLSASQNCSNWSSSALSEIGKFGQSNNSGTQWTFISTNTLCDLPFRLYCFQQ